MTRYLAHRIERDMRENQIVGLSITLVDADGAIWSRGFGWADRDGQVPATGDTVYRMGSVSKLLTGTALMQLADEGAVDIDAPVTEYLPEFGLKERFPDAPAVTPRNLMSHHAGLLSDLLRGADTREPEALSDLTARLSDRYQAQPPGEVFQYSNLGFAVLGRLIEEVGGAPFAEHLEASLFDPLRMEQSSFVLDDRVRPHLSKGYIRGKEHEQYAVREQPASSLYASTDDVARFLCMVLSGGEANGQPVIGTRSLEEMLTAQNEAVERDLDLRVGLTWQLTNRLGPGLGDARIAWHEGSLWHFASFAAVLPDHGLGVVVAANTDSGRKPVTRIGLSALKRMVYAATGEPITRYVPPAPPATLTDEELQRFSGAYDTSAGIVSFSVRGGALHGTFAGKEVQLVPLADGTFAMKGLLYGFLPYQSPELDGYQLEFVDLGEHMLLATLDQGVRIPFGQRIEPVSIPRSWRGRMGRYVNRSSTEDFVAVERIEIAERDGLLVAEITLGGEHTPDMRLTLALEPVSKSEAFVRGVGRFRGDVLEVTSVGGRPGLAFQGYRLARTGRRSSALARR